jgi:glycosyltransferase involved in cell wall biosynthesis
MRICVIIDAWDPLWGGAQTHVWEISKRLAKNNIQIDIFTRSLSDEKEIEYTDFSKENIEGIRIFRVGPKTKFFNIFGRLIWLFTVIKTVISENKKSSYDLVHGHSYLPAIPTKIISSILKIPSVFTVHGANFMETKPESTLGRIEELLLTKIHFTQEISVSHNFLKYPNINKNIQIITNGVNVVDFNKSVPKAKIDNKFNILWVGRFDPVKNVEFLIASFKQIAIKYPKTQLTLLGYGYQEIKITQLIENLGLHHKVTIIHQNSNEQKINIYKTVDLFVLPSFSEGMPITLLEAWAARKPVLVSKVGDNPLLVKVGINGYLFNPNNQSELIILLEQMIISKNLKEMGLNGYKLVRKQYTWDKSYNKMLNIYQKLLKNI